MTALQRGSVVRTSYATGPYIITDIQGPCDCPEYLRRLGGNSVPTEPHYHIACQIPGQPERGEYWLNGYRLDGSCVWGLDRIYVVTQAAQKELFI